MASVQKNVNLKFVINRFYKQIEGIQIDQVGISESQDILNLLGQDGSVLFLHIATGTRGPTLRNKVFRVLWNNDQSRSSEFLLVNSQGDVQHYKYTCTETPDVQIDIHCVNQWDSASLSLVMKSHHGSRLDVLAFIGNRIYVRQQSMVDVLKINDENSLEKCGQLSLSDSHSVISINRKVLVEYSSSTISIWCLNRLSRIASFNVVEKISADTKVQEVVLTKDFGHIAILADNTVYSLDLQRYFDKNPNTLIGRKNAPSISGSQDSQSVDEDFSATTRDSSYKSRGSMYRNKWLSKLGVVDQRVNKPPPDKPAWYRLVGLDLDPTPPSSSAQVPRSRSSGFSLTDSVRRDGDGVNSDLTEVKLSYDGTPAVKQLRAGWQQIVVEYSTNSDSFTFLSVIDLVNNATHTCLLEAGEHVVLSCSQTFPHLCVSLTELKAVIFNDEQEKFVNKLMLYDSAGIADALCRLNEWERCSIPVRSLEVGLKHRQLDTVSFFLKSKENVFRTSESATDASQSPRDLALLLTSVDPNDLVLDLEPVEPAVQLLSATIAENISDYKSKQFAERLLHITMDYLHTVVRNITAAKQQVQANKKMNQRLQDEIDSAMKKLTGYIEALRFHMQGVPGKLKVQPGQRHTASPPRGTESHYKLTRSQRQIVSRWDKINEKEIVTQGIQQGQLPLLQSYLKDRCGTEAAALQLIVDQGLHKALEYLKQKQMKEAGQMLANMGFDVWTKIYQICMYTSDRELRDYLITELSDGNHFTEEELEMVRFVHKFESLYSCPSYDVAKLLRTEAIEQSSQYKGSVDLSVLLGTSKAEDLLKECRDISNVEVSNSETAFYSHVLLDWVRNWDQETRDRVLLEKMLHRKDLGSSQGEHIQASTLWSYLTSHQDIDHLREWIDKQYGTNSGQVNWPYHLPLSPGFLDDTTNTTKYVREQLLNILASQGVFSPSEIGDFPLLLSRLSRVQGVISRPHILELHPETHRMNVVQFHSQMINHCIRNKQPQLLYFYLDYWKLCLTSCDLGEVGQGQTELPAWVDMMLHLRKVAYMTSDPQNVFEASLSSHRWLEKLNSCTVSDMLDQGLIGRALATLMFSPKQLNDVMSGNGGELQEQLEAALKPYPRLHHSFFSNLTPGGVSHDMSVYKLLQGNVPFDISRLFGWQRTNTLAGDDAPRQMPHFSQDDLVQKCAHVEVLQFTYYLRQGRPCFAFCTFIISVIQSGHKVISSKKMNSVCFQVQHLALKHFYQPSVAAACVAFLELLGQDSSGMRVNLQVANLILSHRVSQLQGAIEQRRHAEAKIQVQLGEQMISCIRRRRRYCSEIVTILEKAITWQLDKYRIRVTSFAASQHWILAGLFCRLHQLPLSTTFLTECAVENDWVMFVTYAQLLQYPKEQLSEIVGSFSASHLGEHLLYVVENVSVDMHLTKSPDMSPVRSSKDVRAQLYSKIGVTKPRGDDTSSSSDEQEIEMEETSEKQSNEDIILPPESHSKDVFSLLLACLDVPKPSVALVIYSVRHRNPVLAVLASCFQDCNRIQCLCSWLIASCKEITHFALREKYPETECEKWNQETLAEVLMALVVDGSVKTVLQGFRIFKPAIAIVPFFEFLVILNQNIFSGDCKKALEEFKRLHKEAAGTSGNDSLDYEWVEKNVNALLGHCLKDPELFPVTELLQHLDNSRAMKLFTNPVGDLSRLHQLNQCISKSEVRLNYEALLNSTTEQYGTECDRIQQELLKLKLYNEARLFAEVSRVCSQDITIYQLNEELRDLEASAAWKSKSARCLFWSHCHSLMKRHSTKALVASKFLQSQIEGCQSHEEKSHLCEIAHEWMKKVVTTDIQLKYDGDSLLTQIWMSKIQTQIEMNKRDFEDDISKSPFDAIDEIQKDRTHKREPRSSLLKFSRVPKPRDHVKIPLKTEEKEAFDVLLGQLLDDGHVSQACQLVQQFGHYDQDLAVVVSCLELAMGVKHVNQLDIYIKQLMAGKSPGLSKRRKSSFSMVSLPRLGSSIRVESLAPQDEADGPVDDVLASIEILCSKAERGQQCCDSILTSYRISKVIRKSFQWVVEQDEYSILRHLLGSDNANKFVLSKLYITTCALADNEIAMFLSDGILEALQVYIGLKEPDTTTLLLHPGSTGGFEGITQLLQLCNDPSKLGQKLLDALASFSTANVDVNRKILSVEVELLVYSHDCHTLACNMEGISAVLRAAQSLVGSLHSAEEYNLMIRLLTGVGRFSEMTYIFDILKQQHQFELLIRKGIDKEEKLRISILDYLQRYHPDDTETYTMVSLYFSMNRQIAIMLEKTAQKHLSALKGKDLENTSDIQNELQNIVQYYSDAAESYVKEDCLRHAEQCVKKARLVALQLQMLPTGQQLLNLSKEQVGKFIAKHEKFWEAYMVAEGYGRHNHWAAAINQQVIMNGNFKYLSDLRNHVNLTSSIISEVSERFRSEPSRPKQAVPNMKKLFSHCPDVKVSYRLASELGFSDYTRDLIKSDAGAHLKDTLSVQY